MITIKQGDDFDILANKKESYGDKKYAYVKHTCLLEEKTVPELLMLDEQEVIPEDYAVNGVVKNIQSNMKADIYYERAFVTVKHNYYKDGKLEGTVTEYNNDKEIGEKYDAKPIPKYREITYTIVTDMADFTNQEIVAGGIVISIDYKYTTPSPNPGPGPIIILPDPTPLDPEPTPGDPIDIPDDPTPLDPSPENPEEPEETDNPDDSDVIDIEDDVVPLDDGGREIEEEEVPKSNNPETGDTAPIGWACLGIFGAAGLVGATFVGKRKKEKE